MDIPGNLKFTEEHEWVREEGDGVVTVGITHYAQDALGDIVYSEMPAVGETVESGDELAVVESVKAVSDVYAPVSGEIVEANELLEESPELINESPYDEGWMVKIQLEDAGELDDLMDADAYQEFLGA